MADVHIVQAIGPVVDVEFEPGVLPATVLEELIARTRELDMDEVRRHVDAQRPPRSDEAAASGPQMNREEGV